MKFLQKKKKRLKKHKSKVCNTEWYLLYRAVHTGPTQGPLATGRYQLDTPVPYRTEKTSKHRYGTKFQSLYKSKFFNLLGRILYTQHWKSYSPTISQCIIC